MVHRPNVTGPTMFARNMLFDSFYLTTIEYNEKFTSTNARIKNVIPSAKSELPNHNALIDKKDENSVRRKIKFSGSEKLRKLKIYSKNLIDVPYQQKNRFFF